jgi:hypothetical protein
MKLSLVAVAIAVLLGGCTEDSLVSPETDLSARTAAVSIAPDLGSCGYLRPPAGSTFAFRAYARGSQIYRWDGAAWVLVGPSATLYADPAGIAVVGTHYAGPTWESISGSRVVGSVDQRCTPDANAIPWLRLVAVSSRGPGVFAGVGYIQRLNTVGGKAPAEPGASVAEVREVPYTAEYFFYRAHPQP